MPPPSTRVAIHAWIVDLQLHGDQQQDNVDGATVVMICGSFAANAAELRTATSGVWAGRQAFPGFGSAADTFMLDETSFNISTASYITSHSCSGAPDLTWGNQRSYSYNRSAYPKATTVH